MDSLQGSYSFDQFSVNSRSAEAERLQRQAQILATIDQEIYLQAGLGAGMTVLDVGCGVGVISRQMAGHVGHGRVLGLDLSHELLAVAAAMPVAAGMVEFRWGDIYNLPLPDRSVDFVYARLLFQHLADPLLALAEIQRVLRPGGRVCIVDVAEGWFALDPEPVAFRDFRGRLQQVQAECGGRPGVGKDLGGYLARSGFGGVEMRVRVVTSTELGGIDRFWGLFSFGDPYDSLVDGSLLAEHSVGSDSSYRGLGELAGVARQEMAVLGDLPYAWGAFGLFVAMGVSN